MDAALSPTLLLQVLIIFQSVVFAGFLLLRRRPGAANIHLGGLLVLLAIRVGGLVLSQAGIIGSRLTLLDALALLFGPLIAGHVRSLTFEKAPSAASMFHAVPFLAAAACIPAGLLGPRSLAIAIFVSLGIYLAASTGALLRYRRVVASARSGSGSRVQWLQFAIGGLFAVLVLDIASFVAGQAAPARESETGLLLFIVLLGYVTAFSLISLHRPSLFTPATAAEVEIAVVPRTPELTPADRAELARIEELMRRERLFLQPDLTLGDVAAAARLTPRKVSALINRGHERTFADWVNGYRVEEAKRLLASPAGGTILEILHASGFNSKSTFNSVFRQVTGQIPSRYRAQSASQGNAVVNSS